MIPGPLRSLAPRLLFAMVLVLSGPLLSFGEAAGQLAGVDGLARAYDAILDADFAGAEALLTRACGPAPAPACDILRATALWWRVMLDPASLSRDAEFARRAEHAIAAAEAWVRREPARAEAWFYLGGAYGVRIRWRAERGEFLAAARDGKRVKTSLERALALNPNLEDAHFGIGLYQYYADIAPAIAKLVRWLLLLPGGDRVQGLRRMLKARDRGELLRDEADYQLCLIYFWYEKRPDRALELLSGLRARHPRNPMFAYQMAQAQEVYQHDSAASLETHAELLAAAQHGRVNFAPAAEVRARIGLAQQLDRLFETDRAIDHLKAVVRLAPVEPHGALAAAHLLLGRAYDRVGLRELAEAEYRAALAAPALDPAQRVPERARDGLQRRPDARAAEAYRLSLEGWRLLERHALIDAGAVLARSLQLNPSDPVVRFRMGKLLRQQGATARALSQFEWVTRAVPAAPPTVLAAACLEAGQILEASGDRARAVEMYRRASSVFGGDARTRAAAEQSLARLRS